MGDTLAGGLLTLGGVVIGLLIRLERDRRTAEASTAEVGQS